MFQKFINSKTNSDLDEGPLDFNAILQHLGPFGKWQKVKLIDNYTVKIDVRYQP